MARGYMGKILRVDLTKKTIKEVALDEKMCRQYIGGYGLGARLLWDWQKGGVDPLGPEANLGFITGPLTGTPAIAGTRFTVCGKSPLTGGWGDANSGGHFAAFLKFAGYDGVFFSGISSEPVYFYIDNGKAEIRDAGHLWGKDTYETDDILKAELGKDAEIACIGPAGEKLSLIAGIVHMKGSVAARSGLGAVMGSKKLKAVVVKGNMKVPVADEAGLKETRKKMQTLMGGHISVLKQYGTTFTTVPSIEGGDSPVKNWGGVAQTDFPDAKGLGAEEVAARSLKRIACYQCPIGCEAAMKAGTGKYKWAEGSYRPEYETIVMFGSNCLNNDIDSIIKANDLCNQLGIDTISAGAVVAFAMECYEHGLITKKDTGGLDLSWGNADAVVALTEMMGNRKGIGDLLADGVAVAAKKLGKNAADYAMHVHGQEVPGHSPIATPAMATTYAASATPGRHTQGSSEHHNKGLLPDFNRTLYTGRGGVQKRGADYQNALMCSGYCLFVNSAFPDTDNIATFMRPVTGWDITTDDLVESGERIECIRQAFNLREGVKLMDNKIAGRLVGKPPKKTGPMAGVTTDNDVMLKDYFAAQGWDPETGMLNKKRMTELGMEDVAKGLKI
jgi:aldehyde:ferredoxin oxidoreductase